MTGSARTSQLKRGETERRPIHRFVSALICGHQFQLLEVRVAATQIILSGVEMLLVVSSYGGLVKL